MKWIPNQWTIIRCQDEQLCVVLLDQDGSSVSISGASLINLRLKKSDGSIFIKPAYTGWAIGISQPLWFYGFQLSAAETMDLAKTVAGQPATVEIEVKFGDLTRVIEFPKSLTVIDRAV